MCCAVNEKRARRSKNQRALKFICDPMPQLATQALELLFVELLELFCRPFASTKAKGE